MTILDRVIQYLRICKILPYIGDGARLLDIGCADGALFTHLQSRIREGIGIDPALPQTQVSDTYCLIAGHFPGDLPDQRYFDVITLLAVLEHIPPDEQRFLAEACARLLTSHGYVVITAPSPHADRVLHILRALRLIDGMALDEHYGFDVANVPATFSVGGLTLVNAQTFQLGFNNLFVFQKCPKYDC